MKKRIAPLLLAFVLIPVGARAEGLVVPKPTSGEGESYSPPASTSWLDYNARPLTLAKGMVGIHGDLVVDISNNHWGKPLWITPNVYYGVSDSIMIGVAENPQAD